MTPNRRRFLHFFDLCVPKTPSVSRDGSGDCNQAKVLETIHFGPECCGRALSPEERGEWADGNERTGDEASSRRERSETAKTDDNLTQKFKSFASRISVVHRQASDVAARSCQTRDEAAANRVVRHGKHDRDDGCGLLCRGC